MMTTMLSIAGFFGSVEKEARIGYKQELVFSALMRYNQSECMKMLASSAVPARRRRISAATGTTLWRRALVSDLALMLVLVWKIQ